MADISKTNALRIIEKSGTEHSIHVYSSENGIDGLSVAASLNENPDKVFKTLVAQGKSRAFYVFVIPVGSKLSLKLAAQVSGEKSVEMIPQKLLLPTTGYVHGGCSPIGMKKSFPTFIDETAQLFDTICVSAGKIGLQVELSPDALCELCNARYEVLTE